MRQSYFLMCLKKMKAIEKGILSLLVVMFLMLRGEVFSQDVKIDETKPSSIPAQIVADWEAQDGTNYDQAISKIKSSLPQEYASKITGSGKEGYLNACHWRRVYRMKPYATELKRMIYARHHDIGGAIIGYTEDLNSDGARGLGPWGMTMGKSTDYSAGNKNGTAIHLLEFDNYYPSPKSIITDNKGCVRDPCPNYKGDKIVFAWSKDNNGYALYEVEVATGKTRQIIDNNPAGIRVSDMEPCVLPNNDIVFMSSRCFQHVDCNVNLVSNMYICDSDGKYLRRIGYDQVNTFYPTMREDGSVMYTRWEYNDRNVANVFGIFTMRVDGSNQTEYFGNQTEFPATFSQAREIPGTGGRKALAIIGGHMGPYAGDLVMIDIGIARNVVSGKQPVKLIAPPRTLSSGGGMISMDGVPDENKLFQNPYPLDEEWFLVSYRKKRNERFAIYLMNTQGERELIAWADGQSVSQPVSLAERPIPPKLSYQADYSQDKAIVSVVDVYYGDGAKGINRGDVKKIRVVAMEYRVHPAYGNTGSSSYQMTPVGRFGCSWEAKWIVGEAPVEDDGSAAFYVPPNTPIFLQLIAADGTCLQTMRSWMTLMPGERFDCMGCHEDKNAAPLTKSPKKINPDPLQKFYDIEQKPGSFYFPTVVQPILDQYCVKSGCHDEKHSKLNLSGKEKVWTGDLDADQKDAYRYWLRSYWNLSKSNYANCNAIMGSARAISPKSVGSPRSGVVTKLKQGHVKDLPQKALDIICAWIDLGIPHSGTYTDDMKDEHKKGYLERVALRNKLEDIEKKNIEQFIADGGYKQPKYRIGTPAINTEPAKIVATVPFKAEFIVKEKLLSLRLPSEGMIKVLDLQGRQIMAKEIKKEDFLKSAEQKIKLKDISAGSYVVKFEGVKVSGEQLISVL